jgi:hypothetical protein
LKKIEDSQWPLLAGNCRNIALTDRRHPNQFRQRVPVPWMRLIALAALNSKDHALRKKPNSAPPDNRAVPVAREKPPRNWGGLIPS